MKPAIVATLLLLSTIAVAADPVDIFPATLDATALQNKPAAT